ncbi:NADH-quinone oxidoreductase subunit D [bacterium]|nr:NADH-quinone oxidoreductase subunit D [bacterium]
MSIATESSLKTEKMKMNFGPQHPATHGTLRIEMELEGETVLSAKPEIGFLHCGFEKLCEHKSYNQIVNITDRMNYLSPFCNNLAFILAAEKLFDIQIPKRGQYIRVILAELSRIADHCLSVGAQALDLGAFTAFLYLFEEREKIYDVMEMVSGNRLMTTYTRVGGFARDRKFTQKYCEEIRRLTSTLYKTINEVEKLLNNNKIFHGRTVGIGVISGEEAVNYGLTGPCLRGSGIDWDIRVSHPYCSYEDFDFDVPIAEGGDIFSRYLVRMEEMKQSMRIVEQALANFPDGPENAEDEDKYVLPPKNEVYGTIEGLIHQFEITMENRGFKPPKGEVYFRTEAPNGELGYFIVSDGGRNPYRVRVRPPSLVNYQVLEPMMKNQMLSDTVSVLGSLNIIAGELDR